jgi:6-phosphogluconolactonase (cycloisomerase 2 family)
VGEAGSTSGGIRVFMIDATTGALTPAFMFFSTEGGVSEMVVEPTGRFLYVLNACSVPLGSPCPDTISVFRIDATTGGLTEIPGSPFFVGFDPIEMTLEPSGQFLYVDFLFSDRIAGFRIDATMGGLTEIPGSMFVASDEIISITTAKPRP